MTRTQIWIAYATLLALAALLAGLVLRRFHRLCYGMLPYLGVAFVTDALVLLRPATFWTWDFWMLKTAAIAVLRLGVALELGALIFQAFPGARATARQALALGLLGLLAGVLLPGNAALEASGVVEALPALAVTLQPRLSSGAALLLLALLALSVYYNVPLHPWHRAILTGTVPYLLVFTVAFDLIKRFGRDITPTAYLLDNAAYLLLVLYWNWALWRPEEAPAADPEVVSRLHPWRARLERP